MARCAICEHPKRAAIEAELDDALTSVDGMSALASRYALTVGQIKRHPGHPPAEAVQAPQAKPTRKPAAKVKASKPTPAKEPAKPPRKVVAVRPPPVDPEPDEDDEDDEAPVSGKRALQHAREHVRDLCVALKTADGDDKLELRKAITTAISTQGRLERAEMERVSRILKSPEWKRIETALISALRPFGGKVLRAAGEALAKLDAQDAADADPNARAA